MLTLYPLHSRHGLVSSLAVLLAQNCLHKAQSPEARDSLAQSPEAWGSHHPCHEIVNAVEVTVRFSFRSRSGLGLGLGRGKGKVRVKVKVRSGLRL